MICAVKTWGAKVYFYRFLFVWNLDTEIQIDLFCLCEHHCGYDFMELGYIQESTHPKLSKNESL